MPTTVFLLRHGVRGLPQRVTLADGSVVPMQAFSDKQLPFYAFPAQSTSNDGTLSGAGWRFCERLGALLRTEKGLKNQTGKLVVRANIGLERTVNSGVALGRGGAVQEIHVFRGPVDPLFDPVAFHGYVLPPEAVAQRRARYRRLKPAIRLVAKTIQDNFGQPLPRRTRITAEAITGLLAVENIFAQHVAFSLYSDINLGLSSRARRRIARGIVLRQQVENVPIFVQQSVSVLAVHLLATLRKASGDLHVWLARDTQLAQMAVLLGYSFQFPDWPMDFVNVSSGLMFTFDETKDLVVVRAFGLRSDGEFGFGNIAGDTKTTLRGFSRKVKQSVNPLYVDEHGIDNLEALRVT